jgi:hypothetical protein
MSTALYEPDMPRQVLNFVGWLGRDCGEHRTVGDYRAWCHACSEWCYSNDLDAACHGCRMPHMEAWVEQYWTLRRDLTTLIDAADEAGKRKVRIVDVEIALAAEKPWTASTATAQGSSVWTTMGKRPEWPLVQQIIDTHDKAQPPTPDLLIAVTEVDVLRRFRSVGWIVL